MARRRWQTQGHLYKERGYWKLRYREDVLDENGKLQRKRSKPQYLGPSEGPAALTEKQAKAMRDKIMAKVNIDSHQPQSLITVGAFIEQRFMKDHVAALTFAGQEHYRNMLRHVIDAFGDVPLRDLRKHHVQRFLLMKAEYGLSSGYLRQIRNSIHTVYQYAEDCEFFTGRNPAHRVKIPATARRPDPIDGYSLQEFRAVVAELPSPIQEMFLLGAETSMHGAELAGLRVCHLNLGDEPRSHKGTKIPPRSLFVCENVYRNRRGPTKNQYRRRTLPIPPAMHARLSEMVQDREPDDPVFVMPKMMSRARKPPVDTHNACNRILGPIGKKLGFRVTWQRIRHTNATWTSEMLADDNDRAAMMGHWSTAMTERYTNDFERKRRLAEAIEQKVMGEASGAVN